MFDSRNQGFLDRDHLQRMVAATTALNVALTTSVWKCVDQQADAHDKDNNNTNNNNNNNNKNNNNNNNNNSSSISVLSSEDDDNGKSIDGEPLLVTSASSFAATNNNYNNTNNNPVYEELPACDAGETKRVVDSILANWAKQAPTTSLSAAEFLTWAKDTRSLDTLLAAIKHASVLVLGLRPGSAKEEHEALSLQLRCDAALNTLGKSGTTCYIVSHAWWQRWQQYVGVTDRTHHNAHASHNHHHHNDATALPSAPSSPSSSSSSSFPSSTAAASAGASAGSAALPGSPGGVLPAPAPSPGQIDNSDLFKPLGALERLMSTRFGPRLKQQLVRQRDYEVLSQKTWSALYHWYGADHPLPRPVLVTAGGLAEVELYPLCLKVMRHSHTAATRSADATDDAKKLPQVRRSGLCLGVWGVCGV